MAMLSRTVYKTIEWHLYNYPTLKEQITRERDDIILAADYSLKGGPRGSGVSDTTGSTVQKLEELGRKETWCTVVEETIRKYEGGVLGVVMEQTYLRRRPAGRGMQFLYIDRSTYYKWRKEIVNYAAMKACERRLISV